MSERTYYAHPSSVSWWATVELSPVCLLLLKGIVLTLKVETLWGDLGRPSQPFYSALFSVTVISRHPLSHDRHLINILRFLFGY